MPTTATTTTIRGAELVAFLLDSPSGQTRSILIEAARPAVNAPAYVGWRKVSSPRQMLPPPAAALSTWRARKVDATASVAPATMGKIEQTLKRLGLDGVARRNDLSGTFVVEATAGQIRELAATPGVQAIRANRRHRNIASQDCRRTTMDPASPQRRLHDPAGQGIADRQRLAQQLSDVVDGRQMLSPAQFIEMMGLDADSFASHTHVHRSTVIRAPAAERIQAHIRTSLRVLAAVAAVSGAGLQDAIFWYRNEPLARLNYKTAEMLVAEGRAANVLNLLESFRDGFVG